MTEFEQVTDDQPTPVTPGTMLAQARERAGITQEQVARELHITVTKVKSIESDDYLRLNTDTFIRGYLRAYANFLKLDSAPIIAAYQQHAASQGLVTEPQYPISKEAPTKKIWVFVSLLILLLAGLWLISVWFFDNQVERPLVVPPAVVPSTVVPQTSVPGISVQSMTAPAEPGEEPATATDAEPVNAEGADAVQTTTPEESAGEGVPQEQTSGVTPTERTLDRLELSFAEECWLEVSDAQGDVLATELQRPGSSVSLLGVAPFSVKLGNATAARVMLNGDEVAINPSTGTKVMTISVGE
ncbi:helix-turn-helix domain-containing protein [Cellvibrio sp. ARAG 10.3]|uniref:helix-turn-helix domain-containing protein n=1 Tax=Cellvibrio sp. ARAG 10.3 TaxID=3451358 RepID=UPI003F45FE32